MKAKEKAKELVDNFREEIYRGIVFTDDFNPERERRHVERSKLCALIAVDEILNYIDSKGNGYHTLSEEYKKDYASFEEVRNEIEKL